jgi:hypothetical protein
VLGEEKTPTARLAMSVVLAAQEYCLRRTKGAATSQRRQAVLALHGPLHRCLHDGFPAPQRAHEGDAPRDVDPQLHSRACAGTASEAVVFGYCVVIVARSENGLVPGRIVDAILQLRGVPLDAVEWPAHLSKTEPLLLGAAAMSTRAVARDKKELKSSGGKDTLLPRVRAVFGST